MSQDTADPAENSSPIVARRGTTSVESSTDSNPVRITPTRTRTPTVGGMRDENTRQG